MIDGVGEEDEVQETYHRCSKGKAQVDGPAPASERICAKHSGKIPWATPDSCSGCQNGNDRDSCEARDRRDSVGRESKGKGYEDDMEGDRCE